MTTNHSDTHVLLVDGNSLGWRAFHVSRMLHDAQRRPTGMIYTFLRALRVAIEYTEPTACWVAWDYGESWRRGVYAEYKQGRKDRSAATRADFDAQRDFLRETVLPPLGVGSLDVIRYEADDVIALLCQSPKFARASILSSDHDFWQLIDARVHCLVPVSDGSPLHLTLDNFAERAGVATPEQFFAARVLSGDASDHISGLPRVGLTTARKMVRAGDSLGQLCERFDETQRALVLRNTQLMSLAIGAARLKPHFALWRRTWPPDFNLQGAKNAVYQRQMFSLYAQFDTFARAFVALHAAHSASHVLPR